MGFLRGGKGNLQGRLFVRIHNEGVRLLTIIYRVLVSSTRGESLSTCLGVNCLLPDITDFAFSLSPSCLVCK